MKRYLFLIFVLLVAIIVIPGRAEKLESNSYTLYDSVSPGQAIQSPLGYVLKDSKGVTFGPKMGSLGYTFIPGLFGLGTAEGVVTPPIEDNGLIQQTTIVRVADSAGSDIRLSWAYKQGLGITAADIWRYGGQETPLSAVVNDWEKVAANVAGPSWDDTVNSIINSPKVGDGVNAYYRIVPANTVQADILLPANNARTAGKVDVDFPAGYTLFEIPLWTMDMSLSKVIGDQLDNVAGGDELYDYSMKKSTYASGTWVGNPLSFEKGRGYYLRILNSPKKLTFVGIAELINVNLILTPGYSMVGNPYPLIKPVADVFQNVSVGEELYDKFARKKTYTATGWVGATYDFGIGDGFWFRRMSNTTYEWQLQP